MMMMMVARSLSSSRLSLHRNRLSVSANAAKTVFETNPQSRRRLLCTEPSPNREKKPSEEYKKIISGLVEMCKGLENDGHEKEALNVFYGFLSHSLSHNNSTFVPPVLIATMLIIREFDLGYPNEALSLYGSFLESGGVPNAYTYAVLVKGLSMHGTTVGAAKKFMVEMMGKRIKPNAKTVLFLMDGLVKEGKAEEGRKLVQEMKLLGVMPRNEAIEEALVDLKGPMIDIIKDILSSK